MSRCSLLLGMFCAAVWSLSLPASGFSQTNAPEEKPSGEITLSETPAPSQQDIRQALLTKMKVEFKETPLNQVLKTIAEATGTNIYLDEQALMEEGINPKEPITHKSQPLAAARVMDHIFPALGLTWIVHNDVVQVTTWLAAEDIQITRTYPVGDLMHYAKKHRAENTNNKARPGLHTVQFGGPAGGAVGQCFNATLPAPNSPASWLIDLLQNFTSGPWGDIDGTGGSMSFLSGNLVVRQTHHVQQQVAGILETLRRFTKGKLKHGGAPIHPPHYAEEEDEAARKALTKVVSVKCTEMPLNKFLVDLTTKLEIPFHIDQQALQEEGVAPNEPVTAEFKNVPAASMLKIMLTRLGLRPVIDDGRLLVTTIIAAEDRLDTVLYDVRDFEQREYTDQQLIDLLTGETSGPWVEIRGTGGEISAPLPGLLAVRQTQRVHNQISVVLTDLRKQLAEAPPQAVAETPPPDPKEVVTRMYRIDFISQPESAKKAIFALIEPKTWAEQGGEGDIVIVDRTLVVKNQNAVQQKVQEFLENLQKAEQAPRIQNPLGTGDGNGNGGGMGNGGGNFFRVAPRDPQ